MTHMVERKGVLVTLGVCYALLLKLLHFQCNSRKKTPCVHHCLRFGTLKVRVTKLVLQYYSVQPKCSPVIDPIP